MTKGRGTGLSRREFAVGGAAAGTLLVAPTVQAAVGLQPFMALSRRLTGRRDLDPKTGAVYLHALTRDPKLAEGLERLVANAGDRSPEGRAAAREILQQWFTGIYRTSGTAQVATFDGALMWASMAPRRPLGTCRGPVGYWSKPPKA